MTKSVIIRGSIVYNVYNVLYIHMLYLAFAESSF